MKQEIHFVTGKGGVGKSAVAAALAYKKSLQGKKTLLVEMGDQSFYKDYFDLPQISFRPSSWLTQLDVALWSGPECLREYALHLIKVERLYKIFFENSVMRAFINVAPALPELAIMGKVTSGPRQHGPPMNYDCLVIDCYATGHFLALMRAAPGMAKAIQMGPMGEQSRGIDACLKDPAICHYHVVTLPEELPMKESAELIASLQNEFGIKAELILNKLLKTSLTAEQLKGHKYPSHDLQVFADYVEYQVSQQEGVKKRAENLSTDHLEVPMFYEHQPLTIIKKISEVFND